MNDSPGDCQNRDRLFRRKANPSFHKLSTPQGVLFLCFDIRDSNPEGAASVNKTIDNRF